LQIRGVDEFLRDEGLAFDVPTAWVCTMLP